MIQKIFFLVLLIASFSTVLSQNTEISGTVSDKKTGEPIPYANIYFSGTFIGTMSDINGNFKFTTAKPASNLEISAIGYKKQTAPIKIQEQNLINFQLEEEVFELSEIDIYPGENPAHRLLKNIIANKKANNPNQLPSWESRIYAKTEIDIKNVNSKLRDKKVMAQFDFVFNYIDSMEIQGKTFLPVFFNETVSNYYHDKETNKDREEIIANKASGMQTDMFSQFTGKRYENINIYENYITFYDIGFISPVNNLGLQFYKYYLTDSTLLDGKMIYEISFRPKLPQEPVFLGKFWVEDSSFALTKVEMQLSEQANVNFINNLQYAIEFQKVEEKWAPRNESLIADIDIQKNKNSEKMGIIARKKNIYQDFRFKSVAQEIQKFKEPIIVADGAAEKDNEYWISNRPIELQQREKNIYEMVDSIKGLKLYRTAAEYLYMFYYGYRDLGKVELGPYYYLYSNNLVEGARFRLGARTTFKFDKNLRMGAYGAYGTLDKAFKYGADVEYYFSIKPLTLLSFHGQHDMEMLGKSSNAFMEQNIMTTLLRKNPNSKLNMIDKLELTAKKEWIPDLMNELKLSAMKIYTAPFVPLINAEGEEIPFIKSGEIKMSLRYAPGEDIVQDDFERNAYSNYDPTYTFGVTKGIKGVFGDYNYLKINAGISDKITMNPIGYSNYYVQVGKIWGDVPFPFLKIHEGNETYAYDKNAFNLMYYQEFISDTYASIFWEHHFVGFFLNKIPVFRKLKWREVVGMRSLWGSYNTDRHNSLVLPGNMKGLGGMPYTEVSAGIENIFKIIRIDGVWRFNYNDQVEQQFGLLFSLQLTL